MPPLRKSVLLLLLAILLLVAPASHAQESPAAQPGDPPLAALITISAPDVDGIVTLSGAAGAVFPSAMVAVRNLYTSDTVSVRADFSGAFTAALYGPGTTPFWISPAAQISPQEQAFSGALPGGPGTILWGQQPDADYFTLDGSVGAGSGSWHAEGRVTQAQLSASDSLAVQLDVTLTAPGRVGGDLLLGATLSLDPVPGLSGNGWSTVSATSGLPVNNLRREIVLGDATATALRSGEDGDTLTFSLSWDVPLDTVPPGLYAPAVEGFASVTGAVNTWTAAGVLGPGDGSAGDGASGAEATRLPLVVQVGQPEDARLLWVLFYDSPSSAGGRGILAAEDEACCGLSGRSAFESPRYVLPRVDSATGEPIPYPLEPYLPQVMANDAVTSGPPLFPLVPERGAMTVTVTRPDGSLDDLGTTRFAQNRLSTPAQNDAAVFGATNPLDVFHLTTLDPRLTAYTFTQDGPHRITLTGTVADAQGHIYSGGGSFTVWLGEPLALLPGVLPGTPFEVGDAFAPTLSIVPAFPAQVEMRLTVYPLDGDEPQVYQATGQADDYGYFQAGDAAWVVQVPGEYVVDYWAEYRDALGRAWYGAQRGAGVIASTDGVQLAHGQRGESALVAGDQLAWYTLDHIAPGAVGAAALPWPYHSGDVLWLRDGAGLQPELAGADDQAPAWREDAPAYAYFSAVRPDVSARQFVLGDEAGGLIRAGWDTNSPYAGQYGSGLNGDLPGDFTFLFGGLVEPGDVLAQRAAAIYGALAVVVDSRDPLGSRVYPPFGNSSGGPYSGPLLTLGGRAYDAFFHPTGFRPGQVFTPGEVLPLAGQVAPTLPAQVAITVESPVGEVHRVTGRANAIGYFYDPAQTITLDAPGIWRLGATITYDGLTSAGPVQPPYPSGDVLRAPDAEFVLYVVPQDALVLDLFAPLAPDEHLFPAQPFNVTAAVPDGWTEVQAHATATMPGYILQSGPMQNAGGSFTYHYDPRLLAQTFSNLDVALCGTQQPTAADVVTITVFVQGLDADGAPAYGVRTLTLLGDRLLLLYDGFAPSE